MTDDLRERMAQTIHNAVMAEEWSSRREDGLARRHFRNVAETVLEMIQPGDVLPNGWVAPDEATEEMIRAIVAIHGAPDKELDQMEPIPGTGQGDLQYQEFWKNCAEMLKLWPAYEAMRAAAIREREG